MLGTFILTAGGDPVALRRAYAVVCVVVAFSVVVQGGTVPWLVRRLRLPVRVVEPEPWALGMRFTDEPEGVRRFTVAPGAPADGQALDALVLGESVWISLISRSGRLVQVRGETVLQAGDEVVVLVEPDDAATIAPLFTPSLP
jgi:cell volume regulation protein A